jgi:hypothetical protein
MFSKDMQKKEREREREIEKQREKERENMPKLLSSSICISMGFRDADRRSLSIKTR